MTTEHIIETLRHPGDAIPGEELAVVVERKEEFVPLLIAELERVTQAPEEADPEDSFAAFALYLLAEMRETRGLQPVLNLLALDPETVDLVLGDVVTQDGSRILAALCQDQPAALREFVKRTDVDVWSIATALDALVLQVRWGWQPREAVVAFFQELLEANQFLNDEDAWSLFVDACYDLHPSGLLEGIRGLYERDVVGDLIAGPFEELEQAARQDPATFFATTFDERRMPIGRTADEVTWWGTFSDESEDWDEYGPDDSSPVIDLPAEPIRVAPKIGRNDLCPCGSGKKYKKCCLPAGGG